MTKRSEEEMLRLDFFKQPVPSFTLEKKHQHGTMIGLLCTAALFMLITAYGCSNGLRFLRK